MLESKSSSPQLEEVPSSLKYDNALLHTFRTNRKYALLPLSNHTGVQIFDKEKMELYIGDHLNICHNGDARPNEFVGDSFHSMLKQVADHFSVSAVKEVIPNVGVGLILAPATRNQFRFNDNYEGVTHFSCVHLNVRTSTLHLPCPYSQRDNLRDTVRPSILDQVDGIRNFNEARDLVERVGAAYLQNVTFGGSCQFSTSSYENPMILTPKDMMQNLYNRIDAFVNDKEEGNKREYFRKGMNKYAKKKSGRNGDCAAFRFHLSATGGECDVLFQQDPPNNQKFAKWTESLTDPSRSFASDNTLAVGGVDNNVTIDRNDSVYTVAYSPDGKQLAVGDDDNKVMVYDVSTWQVIHQTIERDGSVNTVAYSPDGKQLAVGGDDNKVMVYDASTWQVIHQIIDRDHRWVNTVAYSPDGKQLAVGGDDDKVMVYDVSTWQVIQTIDRYDSVYTVAYSPIQPLTDSSRSFASNIIDFELGPISQFAESGSPQERWLELAIADYAIHLFKPYRKYQALVPIRNNDSITHDILNHCNSIITDSWRSGWVTRTLWRLQKRNIICRVEDIVAKVGKSSSQETLPARLQGNEHMRKSLVYEEVTEPELKAYLLSLVNDLRKKWALTDTRRRSSFGYFFRYERDRKIDFRIGTTRHLKEMSDLCRTEESIIRENYGEQEMSILREVIAGNNSHLEEIHDVRRKWRARYLVPKKL